MTKKVMCGGVQIGGGAPISIQSMCNADTRDVSANVEQITKLYNAGCEIIRLAVPSMEAAAAFGETKKILKKSGIMIPMVADIHFDYRLALESIKAGADKIRINPGNIGDNDRVRKVVDAAKEAGIPIRVGVNSGSLEKDILERDGRVTARGLADSALRNVRILEDMNFDDIVISMKASNVEMNYEACKLVASETDHPLHIGVTETGTLRMGRLKSAIGIGALLLSGVGDTMRVSLTADPVEEVICAKEILKALGVRKNGIDFVSCPTCGRTRIDIVNIAEKVQLELAAVDDELQKKGKCLKLAVMGCAVNGPGEAREADLGLAGGEGKGIIFEKGEIVKTLPENELVAGFVKLAKEKAALL